MSPLPTTRCLLCARTLEAQHKNNLHFFFILFHCMAFTHSLSTGLLHSFNFSYFMVSPLRFFSLFSFTFPSNFSHPAYSHLNFHPSHNQYCSLIPFSQHPLHSLSASLSYYILLKPIQILTPTLLFIILS